MKYDMYFGLEKDFINSKGVKIESGVSLAFVEGYLKKDAIFALGGCLIPMSHIDHGSGFVWLSEAK